MRIPRYSTRCLLITTLVVVLLFLTLTTLTGHFNPRATSKASLDLLLEALPAGDKDDDKPVFHEPSDSGLPLEQLKGLVAGKNGYFVRDWSLGLGWNNMRYIIEASVLQARLLNRVLVIPSFVYARRCEFKDEICSQHAAFVNRHGTVGWGDGRYDMAWKLPMEIMLDLPKLRSYHPVILTTEFMRLHGLDPSNERITGWWNREIHADHSNMTSFHVIPNPSFDDDVFRVDTVLPLPPVKESAEIDTQINATFHKAAGGKKKHLSWDTAVETLKSNGHPVDHDASAEELINRAGWVVTYTYEGQGFSEFAKTIVPPARHVLPRARIHGWVEDFFTMDANVLLLEGETHLERKPGSMRFTTPSARDDYTHFVLSYVHPTSPVIALAETLVKRMTRLTNGRGWFAAHMRRGDFIQIGWVKDASVEAHLKYVKSMFEKGRERLSKHTLWFWSNIPKEDDPYFVATDDRAKESLDYIRKDGAITIYELLTDEERRQYGWPLLFTDVLGIVEQRIAASSAFFYGPAMSSLSGGVLNLRTAMGLDSNSWIVD